MRRSPQFAIVSLTFVLLALSASVALAAPSAWQNVDVTRHFEQDGSILLVSGDLPETAKLPAEAELAVPAGSQLQWIGEILGGPAAQDPDLKYTKTTANGLDLYRFTLTKSRTAQIEVPIAAGQAFDGSTYSSAVDWTASQDVPEVRMSLRVPTTAQVVKPAEGAALIPSDGGYSFYSKTVQGVKAGDKLDLAVAYTIPAAIQSSASAGSSSANVIVPILLVLVVICAGALLAVAVRRKMTGGSFDETQADAEDEQVDYSDSSSMTSSPGKVIAQDDSDAAVPRAGLSGAAKRNLVTAAIAVVLVLAAVVVVGQTTKPRLTGDTITQTFSQAAPCANSVIPLTASGKSDPQATADVLFASLRPLTGLTGATYNWKTSSIEVGYCESQTTEAAIRQALAPTGMVAAGGTTAPPVQ